MWWFLRKSAIGREPLAITMSGVRPGERMLQVNIDDPRIVGALAARVGIGGEAAIVVADERSAERARRAGAGAGALVDVKVAAFDALPFAEATFDLIVVHSQRGFIASLGQAARARAIREWHRVLRVGGRVIAIEPGARTGLSALLNPPPKPDARYETEGGTMSSLEHAGFRPVRLLADRDGARFVEGLKRE